MIIIDAILAIMLSLFSTAVMSYISMATSIGPWIGPTLALCAILACKFLHLKCTSQRIALIVGASSIGGILATACAFSFPTLFFINPNMFNQWLAKPWYFCTMMSFISLSAASFGFVIARSLEHTLLDEQKLPFPIGQMVYKLIDVQKNMRKAYEMILGFCITIVYCILQDGLFGFAGYIPQSLVLMSPRVIGPISLPLIAIDMMPSLWAIGFITGHVIALPMLVGILTKMLFMSPVNSYFFPLLTPMDFVLSFASGMVISTALLAFIRLPLKLYKTCSSFFKNLFEQKKSNAIVWSNANLIFLLGILALVFSVLFYFDFGIFTQLYILFFTFIFTYELLQMAGKIGIAPLGRFATYVMLPALFLFKSTDLQCVIISTFVQVCGGVAAEVLFGQRICRLANINKATYYRWQYFGLVVSCLSIGIIFWLLINHFTLGSTALFAYKAQARALLIHAQNFNLYVLILGIVYGYLLKRTKVNPALALSGILMPFKFSMGLILGAALTLLVKDRERWEPFWSGVFASNSLWMLLRAIVQ